MFWAKFIEPISHLDSSQIVNNYHDVGCVVETTPWHH